MTSLNLAVALEGQGADEEALLSLRNWVQEERISGVTEVRPVQGVPNPENMGIDPITILSVVLASTAVVELVKSIHVWIQSTRPRVKIKLQLAENQFLEIDAENLPEASVLVEEVVSKLKALEPAE
jgi:hypothetical protein